MSTTYSEKEIADKALLQDLLIDRIPTRVENHPPNGSIVFAINITPPTKCADGKRRTQIMDYIDYLFPDPDIESLIADACIPYPGVVQTLSVTGTTLTIQFSIST
jgi:hypothetical protein